MPKVLTAQELAEFKKLVEENGMAQEQAAVEIGIKPGSIRNILKESGYRVTVSRKVEPIRAVPLAAGIEASELSP